MESMEMIIKLKEENFRLSKRIESLENKVQPMVMALISINDVSVENQEVKNIFKQFGLKFGKNKTEGKYISFGKRSYNGK